MTSSEGLPILAMYQCIILQRSRLNFPSNCVKFLQLLLIPQRHLATPRGNFHWNGKRWNTIWNVCRRSMLEVSRIFSLATIFRCDGMFGILWIRLNSTAQHRSAFKSLENRCQYNISIYHDYRSLSCTFPVAVRLQLPNQHGSPFAFTTSVSGSVYLFRLKSVLRALFFVFILVANTSEHMLFVDFIAIKFAFDWISSGWFTNSHLTLWCTVECSA